METDRAADAGPASEADRAADAGVIDASRQALERRFHDLLAANRAALSRLAASYARTPSDREDLLQEIAMALWRALPLHRGECSERTFLFRIAHNRCITHVSRRRHMVPLEEARAEPQDPAPGAEATLAGQQQRQRLVGAIRKLPLIYREIIILALEGVSYKQIADVVGISESNVGVRLNRARARLRDMLEGDS